MAAKKVAPKRTPAKPSFDEAGHSDVTIRGDSVPVTAADVFRFEHPQDVQASSSLMESGIADTLHRCACVIDFLADCRPGDDDSKPSRDEQYGFYLCMQHVRDCLQKQADALTPNGGGHD